MADAPYGRDFAALYDLFHDGKDYLAEARYVRETADEILGSRGKRLEVLDAACGTGSHAIALGRMDCNVTGIDIAPAMIARARRKAREAKQRIRFECQDMSHLSMPASPWNVVVCLFDSLGYLRTDARIARALRGFRKVVRPGGVLIVEVWHAPAMLRGFDPLRVRRVSNAELEAVRIGETRLVDRHLAVVDYDVFLSRGGRSWRRFRESHVNRFFKEREIRRLVASSGFRTLRVNGGFGRSSAVSDEAWHLVVVAQREERS